MDENYILEKIESCVDCKSCMEVCDTYNVTQDELQSPNGRLKIAHKICNNEKISEVELRSIYTCTLCSLCNLHCTQSIEISEIIHSSKIKLVEQDKAPLEIHNKIIKGIIEKDNSVNGNPAERLDWIPAEYRNQERFEKGTSDTLLYLGCMSSFRVKKSASASYELLRKANYDFMILEKEPCCGEYVYSAGDLKLAKKLFNDNFKRFKKLGIKNLVVTCGGCLYAFNEVYPKYVKGWDINVRHIVQVIYELFQKGKLNFKKLNKEVIYHDACRTGRKLKLIEIYKEPRELLAHTSENLKELSKNREETSCCGAGSGIRGVDSSITIKIGKTILDEAKTEDIISSCPLCVFNYRYVAYKTQSDKVIKYITDYLLEALENNI
ncbi:MAG: (Fe-S)-binding protein [Candidatus Thorarchaeota archaeon]